MRIVHHAHAQLGRTRPQPQPLAWVEVDRGGTRFPVRPVESTRFLIGSGTNCHLQLGGDLPMLHSLIIRGRDGWTIEAIAPWPSLHVNGVEVRSARLHPADAVRIGPFAFRWLAPRLSETASNSTAISPNASSGAAAQSRPGNPAIDPSEGSRTETA